MIRTVQAAAVVLIGIAAISAPSAQGSGSGPALNGRYLVTSNGDWAKTNGVYHNETTVRQIWTITSSCVTSMSCTGHLTSSAGWSGDINYDGTWWVVDRVVENWEPCPDGTAAPGDQKYHFWGVDAFGQTDATNTALLAGTDTTFGHSGSCGINLPLVIALPLRLQRIDG
ncbi:hypothetical protein FHT40_000045 [Mycolicibacterium sp. BK556]|uniref:hypothetical protein n=1 Tax=unclassified Mycolicibacterium TaxID=2636767 RepID=UPI001612FE7D|nr:MULTISPECIES: hypothetical protein [unclassified Mycolicibacterium]MBB3600412.1 hypothetical protein [Mycolicibacterium sp. BK556]MBB3630164.1 hypothetical protein [Mycolicibacterium sp. BK607]MBB3748163.1 hypothetical protein [Mycolicibacterium sp. BK634]